MPKQSQDDLFKRIEKRLASYNTLSLVEQRRLDDDMRVAQRLAAEERTRNALKTMAQHGWFLDPDWIGGSETYVGDLFAGKPAEEVDRFLSEQIDGNLDQCLEGLVKDFPHRARFFRSSFAAHERGEYELSIPVLLMQADGICEELLGVQLQARDRNTNEMVLAKKVEGSITTYYLEPLLSPHPLTHNVKERAALGPTLILNRHTVLHGDSLDYPTHANSCRAISYLRYVGWMLSSTVEANTGPNT